MSGESGMVKHLGATLREMREERDVITAEVIAAFKHIAEAEGIKPLRGDSALSRFERGETTPNHLDLVVRAYAEALGESPLKLWEAAHEHWHRDGDGPA